MGGMPRPVFIRGFLDFLKSRFFGHGSLYVESSEGEEDCIEAIRYHRRLKIFENFLL